MQVMATAAVTSALSGRHPVEPRKQDLTQAQKKCVHQSHHLVSLEFINAYSVRVDT